LSIDDDGAEVGRAERLAEAASVALRESGESAIGALAAAIAEAQRLGPDGRQQFVARLVLLETPTACPDPTPSEAAAVIRALVDQACPPGSERRERLGRALSEAMQAADPGRPITGTHTVVSQAMTRLLPPSAAGLPRAAGPRSPAAPSSARAEGSPARFADEAGALAWLRAKARTIVSLLRRSR
jgi:hypothetical protein